MMMIAASFLVMASGLTLEIASPQRAVLVGEPVKIVAIWRASADVPQVLVETPDFERSALSFVIDDGTGPKTYRECARSMADVVSVPGALTAGTEVVVNHVLLAGFVDGGSPQPAFVTPGTYALRAVYDGPGATPPVESNVLTFAAEAPAGEEQAVWQMLALEPHLRAGDGRLERLQDAVGAHPTLGGRVKTGHFVDGQKRPFRKRGRDRVKVYLAAWS